MAIVLGEKQKSLPHHHLSPGSLIYKEIKNTVTKISLIFQVFSYFFFFSSHHFCLLLPLLHGRLQHARGRAMQAEGLSHGSGHQMPL